MNTFTAFFTAIASLAEAVEAYFILKKTSYYYDVSEKHLLRQQTRRKELAALRNAGTIDATDRADQLFKLIEKEQNAWERTSTAYFKVIERHDDTN
jgi:hypothetical protein